MEESDPLESYSRCFLSTYLNDEKLIIRKGKEMSRRSYKLPHRVNVELIGRYLPRYRRELQEHMVDSSQANFFVVCVKLGLFKKKAIDMDAMNSFSKMLFRLVKRRHTHLWDVPLPPPQ